MAKKETAAQRMKREKEEQDARKDKAKKSLSGYKKQVTGPSRAALKKSIEEGGRLRKEKSAIVKAAKSYTLKATKDAQKGMAKAGIRGGRYGIKTDAEKAAERKKRGK